MFLYFEAPSLTLSGSSRADSFGHWLSILPSKPRLVGSGGEFERSHRNLFRPSHVKALLDQTAGHAILLCVGALVIDLL